MKTKVAYLVWNEMPVNNTLFNNQVIDQIKKIKERHPSEVDITLIVSFPILAYLRAKGNYRKSYREAKSFFRKLHQDNNFDLILLNTFFGFNFNAKKWLIPFHYVDNYLKLVYLQRKHRFQIFHCRSYHATRMGIAMKRIFKNVKVIFDARSKFPEEGIFRKSYERESASFRTWKKIERRLMERSDAIISVSHTMSEILQEEYPFIKDRSYTIYTSTNTSVIDKVKNAAPRTNALAFIGEVTDKGVYSIFDILDFYKVYRNAVADATLVIITQSDHSAVKAIVSKYGFLNETSLYRTNSYSESYDILRNCKFGFSFLNRDKKELIDTLAITIIASKTGDYLGAGLPLIYDELIGGVKPLIQDFHLGMLINKPFTENKVKLHLDDILSDYGNISNNCVDFALEYFSSEKNADRYFNIYQKLIPG